MISILMPIYNGIEFIEESVSSILNQTDSRWELLIGINGHNKESEVYQIAKKYESRANLGKIRVWDLHTIKGKSNALNEMIHYCNCEYIALLDVDDIWHEKKLEIQIPFLHKYDIVGSRCIWFGERNGIVPSIPLEDITNFDFTIVNPIINSSSIIKKELCFWNNEDDGVEDYDLWLRLRKLNKKFYNCSQILVKHRIHNASAFNAKGNHNLVDNMIKKYKNTL